MGSETTRYKGHQTTFVNEGTQLYLFRFNCQVFLLCPVEGKQRKSTKAFKLGKSKPKGTGDPGRKKQKKAKATGLTTQWAVGSSAFPLLTTQQKRNLKQWNQNQKLNYQRTRAQTKATKPKNLNMLSKQGEKTNKQTKERPQARTVLPCCLLSACVLESGRPAAPHPSTCPDEVSVHLVRQKGRWERRRERGNTAASQDQPGHMQHPAKKRRLRRMTVYYKNYYHAW